MSTEEYRLREAIVTGELLGAGLINSLGGRERMRSMCDCSGHYRNIAYFFYGLNVPTQ